jgi:hypothetical protein
MVCITGANPIKLFTVVIYGFYNNLECLSLTSLQPSLMFAGKAGAYPS